MTAFAAQGLKTWMQTFSVMKDPDIVGFSAYETAKEKMDQRGAYFGAEMLGSAVVQLWNEGRQDEAKMGPFLWETWDTGSHMSDGRVVRSDLFREAVKSGRSLPFGARQTEELYAKDNEVDEGGQGYGAYKKVLEDYISNLPINNVYLTEIRQFNLDMLEWLTIYLYLGNVSQKMHQLNKDKHGFEDEGEDISAFMKSRETDSVPSERIHLASGPNAQAITNLAEQLNIKPQGIGPVCSPFFERRKQACHDVGRGCGCVACTCCGRADLIPSR